MTASRRFLWSFSKQGRFYFEFDAMFLRHFDGHFVAFFQEMAGVVCPNAQPCRAEFHAEGDACSEGRDAAEGPGLAEFVGGGVEAGDAVAWPVAWFSVEDGEFNVGHGALPLFGTVKVAFWVEAADICGNSEPCGLP